MTMSKPQLNHNLDRPQANITFVGLDMKMALHTTPPTTLPYKLNVSNVSALSCYWPNFDETLKVGS